MWAQQTVARYGHDTCDGQVLYYCNPLLLMMMMTEKQQHVAETGHLQWMSGKRKMETDGTGQTVGRNPHQDWPDYWLDVDRQVCVGGGYEKKQQL